MKSVYVYINHQNAALIHVCLVLKDWERNTAWWLSRPKHLGAERFEFARLVFRLFGTTQGGSVCSSCSIQDNPKRDVCPWGIFSLQVANQWMNVSKMQLVLWKNFMPKLELRHPEKRSRKVSENHFGNINRGPERRVTHLYIPVILKVPSRIFMIFTRRWGNLLKIFNDLWIAQDL